MLASHQPASFRCELTGKVFVLVSLFNFQGPVTSLREVCKFHLVGLNNRHFSVPAETDSICTALFADSFVIIPLKLPFVNTFFAIFLTFCKYGKIAEFLYTVWNFQ